ncbi:MULTISPECIES: VOC family protein [Bacillus]|uniref:Lactoylglutathione lyase n=1 Tax=Bacillus wiedmannii TaxID=1890302 RepID=A0A1A9PZ69_9BACI|nr:MULTISPECIES: VOC family protein [Bacillus]OUB82458.1 lactoylglutathione lyase [Bacillus thuringiensis serovar sinensis]KAA0792966.1 lactoylglutathione lyase [Bacillus sp. BPN334]MBG9830559.1 lactoylglutathione lyase [Bacillus wiedmannii]MBY7111720.1 VOC family protein [Bacillus sp. 17RED48]MBY7123657.1 VOC family protein [Bacillus sp. 16GRE42]
MESVTTCIVLESKNLKETLYFYEGILGFKPSKERPQIRVTGVWYDIGSTRICFVVNRGLGEHRETVISSVKELLLKTTNIERLKKKLVFYQISFVEEHHGEEVRIIFHDPDGYTLQFLFIENREESLLQCNNLDVE